MKPLLLTLLLLLTACAAAPPPTSPRLETVREQKESALAGELESIELALGSPIFIRIFKEERRLETWIFDPALARYEPFKVYNICNYSGGLGPKLREGDKQSPEGFYDVSAEQLNPWSSYHLSFNLGFPNEYDKALGRTGSLLMVHGGCESIGCYAITDGAIEEVYLLADAALRNGQTTIPVHAFPFRMTARNMVLHGDNDWSDFWWNLKDGYDAFERTKRPPQITYKNNTYAIRNVIEGTKLF